MTDLGSLQRLRDAANRLRLQAHHPGTGPLTRAILTGVADWLEDTARRGGYTTRGVDATNAHRIADVILDGPSDPEEPTRHAPLTDDPCGVTTTPAGTAAVNAYRAHRTQQHPRTSGGPS